MTTFLQSTGLDNNYNAQSSFYLKTKFFAVNLSENFIQLHEHLALQP